MFTKLNVVADVVRSPPSMFRSKSTSKLFLILVVPVLAAILSVVADPAKFIVDALELIKLNVELVVVSDKPFTAKVPPTVIAPVNVPVVPVIAPNTASPGVPVKISPTFKASGIIVNAWLLSSHPKNPVLGAVPVCHVNCIPRSLLSSLAAGGDPPSIITGSATMATALL